MTRQAKQEVYDYIMKSQLPPRQKEAYHTYFHCGPMGKTALNQMCAQMTGTDVTEEWSNQMPGMFGNSLLVYKGEAACQHTGIVEHLYDVTGEMPHPRKEDHENSAAPAQQQIPGTEAASATTVPVGPLKDNKPSKKKLMEAVNYIEVAVKNMAASGGVEVPESVQHTLRWLKKPRTRKPKSKANGAQEANQLQQQT